MSQSSQTTDKLAPPAFNSVQSDFLLENNTTRQLYSDPNEPNVLNLGDINGITTSIVAKTFRWGINTIDPTGTAMAGPGGGRMELPQKWGSNGKLLGINGGIIDWVDQFDLSDNYLNINNPFGFANFGTYSVQNKHFTLTQLGNIYDDYRFAKYVPASDQDQPERNSFTGLDLSLVRVSSTLGLFCDASGFASTTIGWQNNTEKAFSTLIGSNLELSANVPGDGEIVLGISNKSLEHRDFNTQARVFTIGNGDLSNNDGDDIRSDAFYILKSGESYFNFNTTISGDLDIVGDLSLNKDVFLNGGSLNIKNSSLSVDNDVSCSNVVTRSLIKCKTLETNKIFARNNESYSYNNIGDPTGYIDLVTENGIRYKHLKNTINPYDPYGMDLSTNLSFSK